MVSKRPIALLFLSFLALTSCAKDKVTGERKFTVVRWSLEEELELGRKSAPLVEAQYDSIVLDREAQDYLSSLVVEMGQYSVRADELEVEFQLLDSTIPNAFALPGGYVYMTRGLLQELESEGQFISVLGHELGHVEHQHAMFSQSRRSVATAPGSWIASVGNRLPVIGTATDVAGGLVSFGPALFALKYDRGQELEADDRGVHFSVEMGYDPREGLKTFEVTKRLEEEEGGNSLSLFQTHPQSQARIDRMQATIADDYPEVVGASASFRTGGARFEAIVERLRAQARAYELLDEGRLLLFEGEGSEDSLRAAERKFRAAYDLKTGAPVFAIALGEAAFTQERFQEAWGFFEEAAHAYVMFDPAHGHWKPFFYLGVMALGSGEPRVALAFLEGGEARCSEVPELQYFLGATKEELGDLEAAKVHYARVVELTPKGSELREAAQAAAKRL